MGMPVVTVAAGGLPVIQATSGVSVTEAINGRGVAVTKVAALGLPVVFVTEAGVVVPPVTYATLDPATVTAVTLSGGNLVATNTGTTSADQGARVANAAGKTSGKYYFEVTYTTWLNGINYGVGVGTTGSTYTGMGNGGTTGAVVFGTPFNVWVNGGASGVSLGASLTTGTVIGAAVDLDNRKIWFRKSPSGNWNNNASYDPAANTGGITISAGTMVPFCVFGGSGGVANNVMTGNFGASGFAGAVPSGFTTGWPA
jgi:hypothetical protein